VLPIRSGARRLLPEGDEGVREPSPLTGGVKSDFSPITPACYPGAVREKF